MSALEVRPATAADVVAFYGEPQSATIRAVVALEDGKPIGIAGIARKCGVLMMFSEMKPEMRKYPKQMLKAAKKLMTLIEGLPVLAVADPNEPTAERLLRHLGLDYIGHCSEGEVFGREAQWRG